MVSRLDVVIEELECLHELLDEYVKQQGEKENTLETKLEDFHNTSIQMPDTEERPDADGEAEAEEVRDIVLPPILQLSVTTQASDKMLEVRG